MFQFPFTLKWQWKYERRASVVSIPEGPAESWESLVGGDELEGNGVFALLQLFLRIGANLWSPQVDDCRLNLGSGYFSPVLTFHPLAILRNSALGQQWHYPSQTVFVVVVIIQCTSVSAAKPLAKLQNKADPPPRCPRSLECIRKHLKGTWE